MKKRLPVRVEDDTISKLKHEAKQENRSLSNHVDNVLTKHVSKNESTPTKKEVSGD